MIGADDTAIVVPGVTRDFLKNAVKKHRRKMPITSGDICFSGMILRKEGYPCRLTFSDIIAEQEFGINVVVIPDKITFEAELYSDDISLGSVAQAIIASQNFFKEVLAV